LGTRFGTRFATIYGHSDIRAFYRPVEATAQEGGKMPNIGLYQAAAGTDGKREEPNATLRNISPASPMIVKTRQMTLRQEESQLSGIGPDIVLSKGLFIDIREFGLRRGRSGIGQEAMPKTSPTKMSGCFDSSSLDTQFFHEKSTFAFTLRSDDIPEVKIGVENKPID
jgi:hypothetical protein